MASAVHSKVSMGFGRSLGDKIVVDPWDRRAVDRLEGEENTLGFPAFCSGLNNKVPLKSNFGGTFKWHRSIGMQHGF